MPTEKNQTLEQLLHSRISEFTASDRPKEIIDQHVEKMFTSVVDDAFRSYGDMGKAVKEALQAAIPGNVSDMMELTRYNNLIANAMKEKWAESGVEADMVRRTHEAIDEVVSEMQMPEFVSLQKLLEAFAEEHAEEAMQEGWEAPRIEIEESEYVDGHCRIYFDKDPGESRYGARSAHRLSNMLAISTRGREEKDGHATGDVYAAMVDNDIMGKKMGVWRSEWEKQMVALYYGGAKLIIDCDESDIGYPFHD
ncbi:hypothetical protein J7J47_16380 [Halomonas sp. ISL-60]|uniref:hypothetical protein n=1 Tax=Halomonas sp. ISL-56 TaxID=2819149 RepID=UPI001BEB5260|nr:hypothetical protein [Halomonas sp. ISL-56]MBT2773801.1 hypothetical protein [Halomonas sp. ISL-60]MBT2800015.1 hypothetical protein [Halomonas sp. ISL-56]